MLSIKKAVKSREAARNRRRTENSYFFQISQCLPLDSTIASRIDKSSIIKLSISYIQLRTFKNIQTDVLSDGLSDCSKKLMHYDRMSYSNIKNIIENLLTIKAHKGFTMILSNQFKIIDAFSYKKDLFIQSSVEILGLSFFQFMEKNEQKYFQAIINKLSKSNKSNFIIKLKNPFSRDGQNSYKYFRINISKKIVIGEKKLNKIIYNPEKNTKYNINHCFKSTFDHSQCTIYEMMGTFITNWPLRILEIQQNQFISYADVSLYLYNENQSLYECCQLDDIDSIKEAHYQVIMAGCSITLPYNFNKRSKQLYIVSKFILQENVHIEFNGSLDAKKRFNNDSCESFFRYFGQNFVIYIINYLL